MQNRAAFWTLLLAPFLLALAASPASAGIDTWHFAAGFNVGGIDFRVGYAEAGPFGTSFYFEAARPFGYGGYACSSSCYRRGPRYYHHPSCSAVHHHFELYGYAPGYLIERYGPPIAYPPPAYYYGPSPYYYGPSHYYSGPPRWYVRYYGRYDSHRRDRHYRGHHSRGRHDGYDRYRDRYDRDRYDRDRHHRGSFDRGRHDRDRDRRKH